MYGSDEALALRLRDTKANLGFLDVSPYINTNDRPRLPDAEAEAFCRSTDRSSRPCFLAGDIRVNENHGKRLNVSKFPSIYCWQSLIFNWREQIRTKKLNKNSICIQSEFNWSALNFPVCVYCASKVEKKLKSNINCVYLTLFGDQAGPALIRPDL